MGILWCRTKMYVKHCQRSCQNNCIQQVFLAAIYKRQVLYREQSMLASLDHPLQEEFTLLPPRQRHRFPTVKSYRPKLPFVVE